MPLTRADALYREHLRAKERGFQARNAQALRGKAIFDEPCAFVVLKALGLGGRHRVRLRGEEDIDTGRVRVYPNQVVLEKARTLRARRDAPPSTAQTAAAAAYEGALVSVPSAALSTSGLVVLHDDGQHGDASPPATRPSSPRHRGARDGPGTRYPVHLGSDTVDVILMFDRAAQQRAYVDAVQYLRTGVRGEGASAPVPIHLRMFLYCRSPDVNPAVRRGLLCGLREGVDIAVYREAVNASRASPARGRHTNTRLRGPHGEPPLSLGDGGAAAARDAIDAFGAARGESDGDVHADASPSSSEDSANARVLAFYSSDEEPEGVGVADGDGNERGMGAEAGAASRPLAARETHVRIVDDQRTAVKDLRQSSDEDREMVRARRKERVAGVRVRRLADVGKVQQQWRDDYRLGHAMRVEEYWNLRRGRRARMASPRARGAAVDAHNAETTAHLAAERRARRERETLHQPFLESTRWHRVAPSKMTYHEALCLLSDREWEVRSAILTAQRDAWEALAAASARAFDVVVAHDAEHAAMARELDDRIATARWVRGVRVATRLGVPARALDDIHAHAVWDDAGRGRGASSPSLGTGSASAPPHESVVAHRPLKDTRSIADTDAEPLPPLPSRAPSTVRSSPSSVPSSSSSSSSSSIPPDTSPRAMDLRLYQRRLRHLRKDIAVKRREAEAAAAAAAVQAATAIARSTRDGTQPSADGSEENMPPPPPPRLRGPHSGRGGGGQGRAARQKGKGDPRSIDMKTSIHKANHTRGGGVVPAEWSRGVHADAATDTSLVGPPPAHAARAPPDLLGLCVAEGHRRAGIVLDAVDGFWWVLARVGAGIDGRASSSSTPPRRDGRDVDVARGAAGAHEEPRGRDDAGGRVRSPLSGHRRASSSSPAAAAASPATATPPRGQRGGQGVAMGSLPRAARRELRDISNVWAPASASPASSRRKSPPKSPLPRPPSASSRGGSTSGVGGGFYDVVQHAMATASPRCVAPTARSPSTSPRDLHRQREREREREWREAHRRRAAGGGMDDLDDTARRGPSPSWRGGVAARSPSTSPRGPPQVRKGRERSARAVLKAFNSTRTDVLERAALSPSPSPSPQRCGVTVRSPSTSPRAPRGDHRSPPRARVDGAHSSTGSGTGVRSRLPATEASPSTESGAVEAAASPSVRDDMTPRSPSGSGRRAPRVTDADANTDLPAGGRVRRRSAKNSSDGGRRSSSADNALVASRASDGGSGGFYDVVKHLLFRVRLGRDMHEWVDAAETSGRDAIANHEAAARAVVRHYATLAPTPWLRDELALFPMVCLAADERARRAAIRTDEIVARVLVAAAGGAFASVPAAQVDLQQLVDAHEGALRSPFTVDRALLAIGEAFCGRPVPVSAGVGGGVQEHRPTATATAPGAGRMQTAIQALGTPGELDQQDRDRDRDRDRASECHSATTPGRINRPTAAADGDDDLWAAFQSENGETLTSGSDESGDESSSSGVVVLRRDVRAAPHVTPPRARAVVAGATSLSPAYPTTRLVPRRFVDDPPRGWVADTSGTPRTRRTTVTTPPPAAASGSLAADIVAWVVSGSREHGGPGGSGSGPSRRDALQARRNGDSNNTSSSKKEDAAPRNPRCGMGGGGGARHNRDDDVDGEAEEAGDDDAGDCRRGSFMHDIDAVATAIESPSAASASASCSSSSSSVVRGWCMGVSDIPSADVAQRPGGGDVVVALFGDDQRASPRDASGCVGADEGEAEEDQGAGISPTASHTSVTTTSTTPATAVRRTRGTGADAGALPAPSASTSTSDTPAADVNATAPLCTHCTALPPRPPTVSRTWGQPSTGTDASGLQYGVSMAGNEVLCDAHNTVFGEEVVRSGRRGEWEREYLRGAIQMWGVMAASRVRFAPMARAARGCNPGSEGRVAGSSGEGGTAHRTAMLTLAMNLHVWFRDLRGVADDKDALRVARLHGMLRDTLHTVHAAAVAHATALTVANERHACWAACGVLRTRAFEQIQERAAVHRAADAAAARQRAALEGVPLTNTNASNAGDDGNAAHPRRLVHHDPTYSLGQYIENSGGSGRYADVAAPTAGGVPGPSVSTVLLSNSDRIGRVLEATAMRRRQLRAGDATRAGAGGGDDNNRDSVDDGTRVWEPTSHSGGAVTAESSATAAGMGPAAVTPVVTAGSATTTTTATATPGAAVPQEVCHHKEELEDNDAWGLITACCDRFTAPLALHARGVEAKIADLERRHRNDMRWLERTRARRVQDGEAAAARAEDRLAVAQANYQRMQSEVLLRQEETAHLLRRRGAFFNPVDELRARAAAETDAREQRRVELVRTHDTIATLAAKLRTIRSRPFIEGCGGVCAFAGEGIAGSAGALMAEAGASPHPAGVEACVGGGSGGVVIANAASNTNTTTTNAVAMWATHVQCLQSVEASCRVVIEAVEREAFDVLDMRIAEHLRVAATQVVARTTGLLRPTPDAARLSGRDASAHRPQDAVDARGVVRVGENGGDTDDTPPPSPVGLPTDRSILFAELLGLEEAKQAALQHQVAAARAQTRTLHLLPHHIQRLEAAEADARRAVEAACDDAVFGLYAAVHLSPLTLIAHTSAHLR